MIGWSKTDFALIERKAKELVKKEQQRQQQQQLQQQHNSNKNKEINNNINKGITNVAGTEEQVLREDTGLNEMSVEVLKSSAADVNNDLRELFTSFSEKRIEDRRSGRTGLIRSLVAFIFVCCLWILIKVGQLFGVVNSVEGNKRLRIQKDHLPPSINSTIDPNPIGRHVEMVFERPAKEREKVNEKEREREKEKENEREKEREKEKEKERGPSLEELIRSVRKEEEKCEEELTSSSSSTSDETEEETSTTSSEESNETSEEEETSTEDKEKQENKETNEEEKKEERKEEVRKEEKEEKEERKIPELVIEGTGTANREFEEEEGTASFAYSATSSQCASPMVTTGTAGDGRKGTGRTWLDARKNSSAVDHHPLLLTPEEISRSFRNVGKQQQPQQHLQPQQPQQEQITIPVAHVVDVNNPVYLHHPTAAPAWSNVVEVRQPEPRMVEDENETQRKCLEEMAKSKEEANKFSLGRKMSNLWMEVHDAWRERLEKRRTTSKIKMQQLEGIPRNVKQSKKKKKKRRGGLVQKVKNLIR